MDVNCLVRSVAFVALTLVSGVAVCDPVCAVAPENWMKEADVKAKLKHKGYLIKSIRVESGCYEVYGLDPLGRRIQILVDPATARPVPKQ
jgi:hypothetical protein